MHDQARPAERSWGWAAIALAMVIIVGMGLRFGSNILTISTRYDERFAVKPIGDLLERGWSVETAIDFQETKGPAYIWSYALAGEVLGEELNDLRLVSVFFFVLGAIPLLLIARRCGLHDARLLGVAALYMMLPHHAVHSQMVMSEPSFVFGSLLLMLTVLWSFDESAGRARRLGGYVLFGVILCVLLHSRIHAVAYAAAVCFVAFERDRWRSWPWWLTCVIAGAGRIPLWHRWGGLVSPDHQVEHAVGFGAESLTYLGAALVPYLIVFLVPGLWGAGAARRRPLIGGAALVGLLLGISFRPSLELTATNQFQGFSATVAKAVSSPEWMQAIAAPENVQAVVIAMLCATGLASLAALFCVVWQRSQHEAMGVAGRLAAWTIFAGWGMYIFAESYVFDRYILSWAVLMPVLWIALLPPRVTGVQAAGLLAIMAYLTWVWLFVDTTHTHAPEIHYLSELQGDSTHKADSTQQE